MGRTLQLCSLIEFSCLISWLLKILVQALVLQIGFQPMLEKEEECLKGFFSPTLCMGHWHCSALRAVCCRPVG